MNKGGLVAEVSKRTSKSKADVARIVDAAMAVIRQTVARGERVALVGFGTFEKVRRGKRLARNPRRPQETVTVPARDVPSFSPGQRFREEVSAKRRRASPAKRGTAAPRARSRVAPKG